MSTATQATTEREALLWSFFGTHETLRRALDSALAGRHGISLVTYEVLNQIASAKRGGLTLTRLTELSPLSLSRISRLIVDLEGNGLVERRSCTADKRVSYVALTAKGAALVRKSQTTFFAVVDEHFLGRLSAGEVELLAGIFGRLGGTGGECANALAAETA
jgi:DNA-binding MarR family transcriptional regulator